MFFICFPSLFLLLLTQKFNYPREANRNLQQPVMNSLLPPYARYLPQLTVGTASSKPLTNRFEETTHNAVPHSSPRYRPTLSIMNSNSAQLKEPEESLTTSFGKLNEKTELITPKVYTIGHKRNSTILQLKNGKLKQNEPSNNKQRDTGGPSLRNT